MLLKKYRGKVILMSATLDPKTFIEYFKNVSTGHIPIIDCQVNMFPVLQYFLGDLERIIEYKV
jgi:HrpA-like RNA helicase